MREKFAQAGFKKFVEHFCTALRAGTFDPNSLMGNLLGCTVANLTKRRTSQFRYNPKIYKFLATLRQKYGRGLPTFLRGLMGTHQNTTLVADAAPKCNCFVLPSGISLDNWLKKNRKFLKFTGIALDRLENFVE